jgi:hypothetical protein
MRFRNRRGESDASGLRFSLPRRLAHLGRRVLLLLSAEHEVVRLASLALKLLKDKRPLVACKGRSGMAGWAGPSV